MKVRYQLWLVVLFVICGNSYVNALAKSNQTASLPRFQEYLPKSDSPTENFLYNFNTVTLADGLTVNAGSSVPFNHKKAVRHGNAIEQKNDTTFKIKEHGIYLIYFSGIISGVSLGHSAGALRLKVNGNLVQAEVPISNIDGTIILQEIIKISKSQLPAKIECTVTKNPLEFPLGDTAGISIIKLAE